MNPTEAETKVLLREKLERLVGLIEPKMGSINFHMGPGARVAIGIESKQWYRDLREALDEARAVLDEEPS